MRILLLNGPNLNLLGVRNPDVYGSETLKDVEEKVINRGRELGVTVDCRQSNHEGEIIDLLHTARGLYDGVILNAGAYTHYSYAIADAIDAIQLPVAEVHISDIYKREAFRHVSVIKEVCAFQICGEGIDGYLHALEKLCHVRD